MRGRAFCILLDGLLISQSRLLVRENPLLIGNNDSISRLGII